MGMLQGWDGKHTGRKNLATDAIYVFEFPEFEEIDKNPILDSLKGLYKDINSSSTPKQIAEEYIKTFEKINEYLKDIKNSFILHESTKFYLNTERGKHTSFHGREMNIFKYIEEAAYTGTIDTTVLKFMAMNLATDAIGNFNKAPLENYLSIFAGLIMFDDFAIVAKTLTNEIEFSNVKNIHFYRL